MNTPHPDQPDPLAAALRRDAARVQEPPFDAELHHAVIRRIRALESRDTARWQPVLAWVTALVALAVGTGLWFSPEPQRVAHHPAPDFSAVLAAAQTVAAGASFDIQPALPAWMSPTASLLEPLDLSTTNPTQPL